MEIDVSANSNKKGAEMSATPNPSPVKRSLVKRWLPVGIIILALILFFAFGLDRYFSLEALTQYRGTLIDIAQGHPVLAPVVLVALYAGLVAISFPGAVYLTIFSGFMFGTLIGGTAVVIGATIGATIVFLVAKTALGDSLRTKAGPWMAKFEQGFQDNEFSYLLILRLVPAFPFFLVNLAPAFLGMKLRNYIVATFLGIIPATYVFASIGTGAGAILDAGKDLNLTIISDPKFIVPLVGLGILAMIPVVVKALSGKKVGSA